MAAKVLLAWAAGLFEGEGCINLAFKRGARRVRSRPNPRLVMKMTDEDVVRRFAAVVGHGNVTGPHKRKNPKHKPTWNWSWCGVGACRWASKHFGPYLGTRRLEKLNEVIKQEAEYPYAHEASRRKAAGLKLSTRQCSKCKHEKVLSDFTPNQSWCKTCKASYTRDYKRRQRGAG